MTSQDKQPSLPTPLVLTHRSRLSAEFLVVVYIAVIAALARFLGIPYLLFPELGALVYDVLIRPWGKWASQPIKLVVTPAITAFLGTVVTRHFSFNGLTVLLIVALSTVVIALLRSSIAPAMSAGVLPLVLGVKSWLYPSSIILTLIALSAISVIWRKFHLRSASQPAPRPMSKISWNPFLTAGSGSSSSWCSSWSRLRPPGSQVFALSCFRRS
jgi:hypothetical protein